MLLNTFIILAIEIESRLNPDLQMFISVLSCHTRLLSGPRNTRTSFHCNNFQLANPKSILL